MIIKPGIRRNINSISALVKRAQMIAISNNYEGAIYVPKNISFLNQLYTGATPVTAVTDPIGLQLDERLGLALGSELCAFSSLTSQGTGWVFSGGILQKNADDATAYNLGTSVVAGKTYEIRYTKQNHTAGNPTLTVGGTAYSSIIALTSPDGAYVLKLQAGANGTITITGTTARIEFTAISVKLLDGNHSIQATAAARPTWQVDANGKYYISALGTDDCFTSATGGGGTTGFFWCGAIQPTGGAGTLRTLWADNGANTGYKVQLDVSNKLSFSAGNGVAFTTLASTATVNVGTKYYLTVWDDGTNLNVQINNAAAESVARPVVSAGTAGFTRFKDNGAASSFFIGYEYAEEYFKNTGLTAANRATIQALVRACAGL